MEKLLTQIRKFIESQIKTYQKTNLIEIKFGKSIDEGIFKTIYQDNDEIAFIKLIKPFRNYKLSYSQGKIYYHNNHVLKTYNNKYNIIQQLDVLETNVIKSTHYDIQINNINQKSVEEFLLQKKYHQEEEYEEVNIHITQDSNDQLLIFQKNGEYHQLKLELKIELNLPYTYLDDLMSDIKKALLILENEGFTFS